MSTFQEKLDYLVSGYMSQEVKNVELETMYPAELNLFIIQFLGNIFMKFDLVHPNYRKYIKNDGTLVVRDDYFKMFSALSSHAFKSGDIGEFKIRCNRPKGDSIGIISSTKITEEIDTYHAVLDGQKIYYYHGDGWLYKTGGIQINDQNNVTKFKENDIITVKVDCVKWHVTFWKNDEMVGGIIQIAQNEVYYPLVGTCENNVEYELIL